MTQLILFTDLDGALLDPETCDAVPVSLLTRLKAQQIPIILVTNKTRAEVKPLRVDLGLSDPFITENGSGIFIPAAHLPFSPAPGELDGEDYMIELGCPYVQARAALRVIANQLHHSLIGFGDLDIERLQKLSGLSAVAAQHAKARDFSELFITPKAVPTDQLVSVVEDMGFQVVVGDRFCQLIGPTAGTDRAVRQLIDLYQAVLPPTTRLTTVGLGHCPNDLPLLEMVDWPIIVPGPEGPHPQLAERGWPVASAPGPAGWAAAVQGLCEQLGIVV